MWTDLLYCFHVFEVTICAIINLEHVKSFSMTTIMGWFIYFICVWYKGGWWEVTFRIMCFAVFCFDFMTAIFKDINKIKKSGGRSLYQRQRIQTHLQRLNDPLASQDQVSLRDHLT